MTRVQHLAMMLTLPIPFEFQTLGAQAKQSQPFPHLERPCLSAWNGFCSILKTSLIVTDTLSLQEVSTVGSVTRKGIITYDFQLASVVSSIATLCYLEIHWNCLGIAVSHSWPEKAQVCKIYVVKVEFSWLAFSVCYTCLSHPDFLAMIAWVRIYGNWRKICFLQRSCHLSKDCCAGWPQLQAIFFLLCSYVVLYSCI